MPDGSAPCAGDVLHASAEAGFHEVQESGAFASAAHEPRAGHAGLRQAVLRDLSAQQRLLLVLWYAERMNETEIALVLETSADVVRRMHQEIVTLLGRSAAAPARA